MENLPIYISIVFGLTTFLTLIFFYFAANRSKKTLLILITWIAFQSFIGLSGFYTVTDTIPPRFLLLVIPPLILIGLLFVTSKGKQFIDSLDLKILTVLHTIRIPVEFVLYWLFINKTVPDIMTFEGRNFDILSGVSAPIIYYFGFINKKLKSMHILLWNFICLGLLINIVTNAILSAPFPFQKIAFEQPNIAVLYFPFIWLPSCIVPIVLFSHLVSIKQLFNTQAKINL